VDPKVADSLQWLEQLDDPKTVAWVAERNQQARNYLNDLPEKSNAFEALNRWSVDKTYSLPRKAGKRYYYTMSEPEQSFKVLVEAFQLADTGKKVIDPNQWPKESPRTLEDAVPSSDAKWMAWSYSDPGSDWKSIVVRDLEREIDHEDEITQTQNSEVAWLSDPDGFFYERHMPDPKIIGGYTLHASIWFHRVGTSQDQDVLVWNTPEHCKAWVSVTDDGKYFVLVRQEEDNSSSVHVMRRTSGAIPSATSSWTPLSGTHFGYHDFIGSIGDRFFTFSSGRAGYRIVERKAFGAPTDVRELYYDKDKCLNHAWLEGERLILRFIGPDGGMDLGVISVEGGPIALVELPGRGDVAVGCQGPTPNSRLISYTDPTTPTQTLSLDTQSLTLTPVWRAKVSADASPMSTEIRYYRNFDGVQVPIWLTYRSDVALKDVPTVLTVYGGFGVPPQVGFSPPLAGWAEMGGVSAIAVVRGDGGMSSYWHHAGFGISKRRASEDTLAAADFLVAEGITTRRQLALTGASNGGLVVAAAVNMWPEACSAVVIDAAVLDLMRSHTHPTGLHWLDEYGDPSHPVEGQAALALSPLHNLRPKTVYPAMLVCATVTDERVVPWHSYKYVARLAECQASRAPVLLRMESVGGHGTAHDPMAQGEIWDDQLAFLASRLGLKPLVAAPDWE